MKKILIDTDIGIDCDDAMALAAAMALEKQGKISIEGVCTCTAREGSSGCVAAILNYYGFEKDYATYRGAPLECDASNVYAKGVRDAFNAQDSEEESVRFLRKKLANATEKLTLVSLGPLSVIADLLTSQPDDISDLNGVELVKAKSDALYSMAGNFVNREKKYEGRYEHFSEWNVYQNIPAAQTVVNLCPIPLVFCPFEVGVDVLSGETIDRASPVGVSIHMFYQANKNERCVTRSSWDPLTVCIAAGLDWFDYSPYGKITIDDNGCASFEEGEGLHRYVIERFSVEETARKLNELYEQIVK